MSNLFFYLKTLASRHNLPFIVYLTTISSIGMVLVAWGIEQIPTFEPQLNFGLLLMLAALAAIVTTSMPLTGNAGITYHIGSAISIAAAPSLGTSAVVLVAAAQVIVAWLVKPTDQTTWKKPGVNWPLT